MTKSRLVLVLHVTGLRRWRNFSRPITERSKAKPMQSRITFDTQLKIAIYFYGVTKPSTVTYPDQQLTAPNNVNVF